MGATVAVDMGVKRVCPAAYTMGAECTCKKEDTLTRKHIIYVSDTGRIVYRILDADSGKQISVRDRSAGEAPITFVDLILEVTHDLDGFVVPPVRLWDELPRIVPETREDFEGHMTPIENETDLGLWMKRQWLREVADEDFETMGRCQ